MARSKQMLTWCIRAMWREDPALRRFQVLADCRRDASGSAVPVFFTQKA